MTETAAVRVDLRQTTLTESARMREADEQVFLCIENPPPVRSLLRLTIGDEQRAFEVGQVIEVVSEEQVERGCYGVFIDLARLEEQQRVGSEHLQPGISGGAGVPAPVVIMNTNEMMLGEAGSDEDEAAAAGESSEAAGESSEAAGEGGDLEGDAPASEGGEPEAGDPPASEDASETEA